MTGTGNAGTAMSRQLVENQKIPVPQGERGILWAWPGQLSHLPPPAVGIMALTNHKRLGYSRAGGEKQGDPVA